MQDPRSRVCLGLDEKNVEETKRELGQYAETAKANYSAFREKVKSAEAEKGSMDRG